MRPYTLGTFRATPLMRSLVNRVLTSGRISYGPLSHEFEQTFAELHSCECGILVSSGTAALQIALQAFKDTHGWSDGDEVLIPALTFVATANIVYHCKLKPIPVDVEPLTYSIDTALAERAITRRTRAIIPVHPFGHPADMGPICALGFAHNLFVIEDSCEAMFVNHDGKPVGSWGDVGCFSTYVAHILTTGVGGICTTNNRELALRMRSLANHGIDISQLPSSDDYDPSYLARVFRFTSIGHSFRLTELEAALGLAQLRDHRSIISGRTRNAMQITDVLRRYEDWIQLPTVADGSEHSWMVYPIVMREEKKEGIMAHLRQNGIECRDMLPLVGQPCYKFLPFMYPVANNINQRGFYIGCHQDLELADIEHLAEVFRAYFRNHVYPEVDFGMPESIERF